MLESTLVSVPLEDEPAQLDEVVLRRYNVFGDIAKNMGPVVTAQPLGLPNAYVRIPTKAERELFEVISGGGFIALNPNFKRDFGPYYTHA